MSYKVGIRNNATGEVRMYQDTEPWDADGSVYYWTGGSCGCDCNRRICFMRAGGELSITQFPDVMPCGAGAYSVLYFELEDGTRVANEDDEPIVVSGRSK